MTPQFEFLVLTFVCGLALLAGYCLTRLAAFCSHPPAEVPPVRPSGQLLEVGGVILNLPNITSIEFFADQVIVFTAGLNHTFKGKDAQDLRRYFRVTSTYGVQNLSAAE